MKKTMSILAVLMLLSSGLFILAYSDESDAYLDEFPLGTISARLSYNDATHEINPSEIGYFGLDLLKGQLGETMFGSSTSTLMTVNGLLMSGFYDMYTEGFEKDTSYNNDILTALSFDGQMSYSLSPVGDTRLFMIPGNEDTSAFDAALGHTLNSEVATLSVTVSSFSYKMLYTDISEYDKTPYDDGGHNAWQVLNRNTTERMNLTYSATASITFTDSTVKSVTMTRNYSLEIVETLTHVSEHSDRGIVSTSDSLSLTTGDVTLNSSFENSTDNKISVNETFGNSAFSENYPMGEYDGTGYTVRLITKNDLLKDAANAGMITDGEYGYHEENSGNVDDSNPTETEITDNSSVTETENEVNVSFTQENAVMDKDTVNTIIAKAETKNSNVTLSLKDANIVLSPAAMKRLSSDENGVVKNLQVNVKVDSKLDETLVEKAKANGLSADAVVLAISIDITSSGKTDSLGNVEVSIPFKDAKDDVNYAVYYVDNDGNYTLMKDCKVVTDSDGNKSIVFTTDHFSTFVVIPAEKNDLENVPLYVVLGLITICCLYLLLGMFRKSN